MRILISKIINDGVQIGERRSLLNEALERSGEAGEARVGDRSVMKENLTQESSLYFKQKTVNSAKGNNTLKED